MNELEIRQKGWKKFTARVLIVDDNPVNQEISRAMLQNFGCQVDGVTHGGEVLEALTKVRYDLIFMDLRMSEMEGSATVRAIADHIPIIAFTGHTVQDDGQEYLPSGIDDYLGKPFSTDQMGAMLNRWLPGESSQNEHRFSTSRPAARAGADARGAALPATPIDLKILGRMRKLGGKKGKDFFCTVVGIYLKTAPRYLQALREAVAGADAKAMQKAAHSFKSSNGNLGALRLSVLCEELNEMGCADTTQGAEALLSKIEAEYEAVKDALQKELSF